MQTIASARKRILCCSGFSRNECNRGLRHISLSFLLVVHTSNRCDANFGLVRKEEEYSVCSVSSVHDESHCRQFIVNGRHPVYNVQFRKCKAILARWFTYPLSMSISKQHCFFFNSASLSVSHSENCLRPRPPQNITPTFVSFILPLLAQISFRLRMRGCLGDSILKPTDLLYGLSNRLEILSPYWYHYYAYFEKTANFIQTNSFLS